MLLLTLATALSANLHTCEGTARGPSGQSITVSGFGDDAAQAKRSLRQSARFLADQHLLLDASRGWFADDPEALDRLATSVATTGSPTFAVPGWTLSVSTCSELKFPEGEAWSSRWGPDAPKVVRSHPADTLEGARRRACVSPYQISFMQTLKAASESTADDRLDALGRWESALDGLKACWGSSPSTLLVEERAAGSTTPSQCTAISHTGGRLAVGYGAGADRAAEAALNQSLLVRTRRLLGRLGRARNITQEAEGTEAAHTAIVEALERIAGLTGPSDAIDRARLVCNELTPGSVTWTPSEAEARTCNSMSWTERPTSPVTLADAGSFLDETCAMQVSPTLQIVRFSLRGAEGAKRDKMVSSAFMVAGTCESACLGNPTWGTVGKPVVLDGAPDRTSKRTVLAELRALTADPMEGMALLPTLQDPDALKGLFGGTLVPALQKEANRLGADRWRTLDGHSILLPATP